MCLKTIVEEDLIASLSSKRTTRSKTQFQNGRYPPHQFLSKLINNDTREL